MKKSPKSSTATVPSQVQGTEAAGSLPVSVPSPSFSERIREKFRNKGKLWFVLFLLILPTYAGMAVFNYYPKWETVKYSFFRWDGSTIEEFRGLENFVEAFTQDPLFWQTFQLAGILLAANLIKMWPCIFAAITLHRLKSDRFQYIYRVLFVVPMVVPQLVWLLVWKSFYDPTMGILNAILDATGLMKVLQYLNVAMPKLASTITPLRQAVIDPAFGNVWGLGVFGLMWFSMQNGVGGLKKKWLWFTILSIGILLLMGPVRGPLAILIVILGGHYLSKDFDRRALMKWIGAIALIVCCLAIATSMIWTEQVKTLQYGMPAWLGDTNLIIPAILFWGFPWVGTIGVLIYLAGLQNISQDVYEAAELDGVGPIGKLFRIELPLIMTQVRINLIFATINTLKNYGLFLVMLGPHGGPGNQGMVPGLYMYREAFFNSRFGYACALGMVMFAIILAITIFYQRYVKVEK